MGNKIKKNRPIKTRTLWIFLVILIIVALILIENRWGIIKNLRGEFEPASEFEVLDECVLILGKLIHQLENEDSCGLKCSVRCEIENKKFQKVEFEKRENDCYLCKCFCK